MRVAVASGKGGTGKTLVSTGLAWLADRRGLEATFTDADVEEPDGHLFLGPTWEREERYSVPVPELRLSRCSGCGACQRVCAFHAILALADRILLFPELCRACGACIRACPENALAEVPRGIGLLRDGRAGSIACNDAVLDVGEPSGVPLIEAALRRVAPAQFGLVDCPPGTSCSAVASVRGADLALLVTEPTPFGLHDLRLAVEMCRLLGVPPAVVLNRAGLGDDAPLESYLEAERLPLLARIPYSRETAEAVSRGRIAAAEVPALGRSLEELLDAVLACRAGGSP